VAGDNFSRLFGFIVLGLLGFGLGRWIGGSDDTFLMVVLSLGGAFAGLLLTPYVGGRYLLKKLDTIATETFFAIVVGLLLGLVASALFAFPLSKLPGRYGEITPAVVAGLLCYLGIVFLLQGKELFHGLGLSAAGLVKSAGGRAVDGRLLVDTSAIIDGRIADISHTGFISGPLIIPRFVLEELQYIADSPDSVRRKRGRRGLEMLNKLKQEARTAVQIMETDLPDGEGVDAKLVKLAKNLHCPIITNDFNLNRVAELQGVSVLNINELATAVKPLVLPGEDLEIRVIQEGKEVGQGVGFLDDGTMVVIEGGRRHLNNRVEVTVTRVLQTAVGRMIFAQMKE